MLDITGILLVLLAFYRGWQKGIIVAIAALLGIVLGMLAALKLSAALGAWMLAHGWVTSAWAQIISYILLFLGVLWLVRLLAKAIEGAIKAAMLGIINRLTGGLLYAFVGAFIWSSLLWIANRAHLISPEAIAGSRTYHWFEWIAPWVFSHLGEVLPFAKNVFSELEQFFDGVNQHLPGHVGTH